MARGLLSGLKILVIEDDYLAAVVVARALLGAGAELIGPYSDATACFELRRREVSFAVIDLNLGHGTEFHCAQELQRRGVPFMFVSGYDRSAIPAEFDAVPLLQKPVRDAAIVRGVRQSLSA